MKQKLIKLSILLVLSLSSFTMIADSKVIEVSNVKKKNVLTDKSILKNIVSQAQQVQENFKNIDLTKTMETIEDMESHFDMMIAEIEKAKQMVDKDSQTRDDILKFRQLAADKAKYYRNHKKLELRKYSKAWLLRRENVVKILRDIGGVDSQMEISLEKIKQQKDIVIAEMELDHFDTALKQINKAVDSYKALAKTVQALEERADEAIPR